MLGLGNLIAGAKAGNEKFHTTGNMLKNILSPMIYHSWETFLEVL